MGNRYLKFGGRQGAGQRRIGIAIDQDGIGLFGHQHGFDAFGHTARHRAMAQTMDIQMISRPGNRHLLEKNVRHAGIEMLTRMEDFLLYPRMGRDGAADHGGLDELRPRADDSDDFHAVSMA